MRVRIAVQHEKARPCRIIEQPALGEVRIANELRKRGVTRLLCGNATTFETMTKRLKALETRSAQDGLVLTDLRVLTDRGSEYCSNPERHEYELYLVVEDIDHSRTETNHPQTIM